MACSMDILPVLPGYTNVLIPDLQMFKLNRTLSPHLRPYVRPPILTEMEVTLQSKLGRNDELEAI